ncbi:MAG: hypothetical protein ACRD0A_03320 [Acidimicrobiales bacterium]
MLDGDTDLAVAGCRLQPQPRLHRRALGAEEPFHLLGLGRLDPDRTLAQGVEQPDLGDLVGPGRHPLELGGQPVAAGGGRFVQQLLEGEQGRPRLEHVTPGRELGDQDPPQLIESAPPDQLGRQLAGVVHRSLRDQRRPQPHAEQPQPVEQMRPFHRCERDAGR